MADRARHPSHKSANTVRGAAQAHKSAAAQQKRRHHTVADRDNSRHINQSGAGMLRRNGRSAQSVTGDQCDQIVQDGTGTPTPSEKVSRWHRDIFMVSPPSNSNNSNSNNIKPTRDSACATSAWRSTAPSSCTTSS